MMDANDSPPVERYYTYKEAAEILRVTYESLRTIIGREQWQRYRVKRTKGKMLLPESVIRERLASRLQRRERRSTKVVECQS